MIYGLNFGGPAIPTTPRSAFRKFPERVSVTCNRCDGSGTEDAETHAPIAGADSAMKCKDCLGKGKLRYFLAGIGQSKEEKDTMLIVANNGRRKLHVEERQTVGGVWYGIYVW
jgi:DnaJ-class molecular chaperone